MNKYKINHYYNRLTKNTPSKFMFASLVRFVGNKNIIVL